MSFLTSHLKCKLTKAKLAVNETLCASLPDAEGYSVNLDGKGRDTTGMSDEMGLRDGLSI